MDGKDIERMRMIVSDAYPGMKWKARVAKMPNAQIIAIHKSIMARKCSFRIGPNQYVKAEEPEYHQYNLFELGLEVINNGTI